MSDPRAGRAGGRGTRTGPAPVDHRPKRPPRPVPVEIATAILIVTGFFSFFLSIEALAAMATRQEPDLLLIAFVLFLGLGTIAIGIALRYGHLWLLGVNYVAVAGFLELTSGTPQGWLFGALDVVVLAILVAHRPWFAWSPEDDEHDPASA